MMVMDLDPEKVPDADLRSFAAREAAGSRSVIVEVHPGPPTLAPKRSKPVPKRQLAPVVNASKRPEVQALDQLEKTLRALGVGVNLVKLTSAGAIVATVSAEQLRAIARLPEVERILPNRTHRIPSIR